MTLKQTLCVYELLDCANVSGHDVVQLFQDFPEVQVISTTVVDQKVKVISSELRSPVNKVSLKVKMRQPSALLGV